MVTAQKKVTITIPQELKDEIDVIKKNLKTSMNSVFIMSLQEFVKEQKNKKLRLEAQQMVDEYNSNPELIELSNSVEDVIEY